MLAYDEASGITDYYAVTWVWAHAGDTLAALELEGETQELAMSKKQTAILNSISFAFALFLSLNACTPAEQTGLGSQPATYVTEYGSFAYPADYSIKELHDVTPAQVIVNKPLAEGGSNYPTFNLRFELCGDVHNCDSWYQEVIYSFDFPSSTYHLESCPKCEATMFVLTKDDGLIEQDKFEVHRIIVARTDTVGTIFNVGSGTINAKEGIALFEQIAATLTLAD